MNIPETLRKYLEKAGVNYQTHHHGSAHSTLETVNAAHVPIDQVAKGVLLKEGSSYSLAVIPAISVIDLAVLNYYFDRSLELASESDLHEVFFDCVDGAVPAIGAAYGLPTYVEEGLLEQTGLYFEAGNHTELIYVSEPDFEVLLEGAEYGKFSEETPAA